jgi:hypothetical protein
MSMARSDPWNKSFFLVATGVKEPKGGFAITNCEIAYEGTTTEGKVYRVWYLYPNAS